MGIFGAKKIQGLKMDQNCLYLLNWLSDISKITFSFIDYACCQNKTPKNTTRILEQYATHPAMTRQFLRARVSHTESATQDLQTGEQYGTIQLITILGISMKSPWA